MYKYWHMHILIAVMLYIFYAALAKASDETIPSESESIQIAHRELAKYGEIIDLKKTNGQERHINGIKSYVVFIRGSIKLPSGFYLIRWQNWASVRAELRGTIERMQRTPKTPPLEAVYSTPIPAGSLYVVKGEVFFQMTEKGWRFETWEVRQQGWCFDEARERADSCYKSVSLDE